MDAMKTGTLIARTRKEKGLTQRELAEKVYVSVQAVSKWERGESEPSTSNLLALAKLFGVSPAQLLESAAPPEG